MTSDEALVAELRADADAMAGIPFFEEPTQERLRRAADAIERLSAERLSIRAEAFREAATSLLDGSRPLPFDRDTLGRMVREAWVRWAQTQPAPKPSWLVPYDDLAEPDKEADRQIGEAIARWTLIGEAAAIEALATPETETSPDDR